MTHNMKVTLAV